MENCLNYFGSFFIRFILPFALVIFWLPFRYLIRYIPKVLHSLATFALQDVPQALLGTLAWGRFITWKILFPILPHWILFGWFWMRASLAGSCFDPCASARTSSSSRVAILHPRFMVLTGVIHPQGGVVRAYKQSVVHTREQLYAVIIKKFHAHFSQ